MNITSTRANDLVTELPFRLENMARFAGRVPQAQLERLVRLTRREAREICQRAFDAARAAEISK